MTGDRTRSAFLMYGLHCTKKLLDRSKATIASALLPPTTVLGNWYATALSWKPQLALLVNEQTLQIGRTHV